MQRRWLIGGLVALLVVAIGGPLLATLTDSSKQEQKVAPLDAASTSVQQFFMDHVGPGGNVLVEGSTASSDQAIALLLAAANSDGARFSKSWEWARANMVDASGAFGRGADVSDDLIAARALVVAGKKFDDPSYTRAAAAMASAVQQRAVTSVDVAAFQPRAEALLGEVTDDSRWTQLATDQRSRFAAMVGSQKSPHLPADQAGTGTTYSQSAQRGLLFAAESCDAADRDHAKVPWNVLSRSPDARLATAMSTDGHMVDSRRSAMATVASAAAVHAAGDDNAAYTLLDAAQTIAGAHPSADDAAAIALGRVLITTQWMGGC